MDSSVWKWTDATWLELVIGCGTPVSLSRPQYIASSLERPISKAPSYTYINTFNPFAKNLIFVNIFNSDNNYEYGINYVYLKKVVTAIWMVFNVDCCKMECYSFSIISINRPNTISIIRVHRGISWGFERPMFLIRYNGSTFRLKGSP